MHRALLITVARSAVLVSARLGRFGLAAREPSPLCSRVGRARGPVELFARQRDHLAPTQLGREGRLDARARFAERPRPAPRCGTPLLAKTLSQGRKPPVPCRGSALHEEPSTRLLRGTQDSSYSASSDVIQAGGCFVPHRIASMYGSVPPSSLREALSVHTTQRASSFARPVVVHDSAFCLSVFVAARP